MEYITKSKSLP